MRNSKSLVHAATAAMLVVGASPLAMARGGHYIYRDAEGRPLAQPVGMAPHSVARQWSEALLDAIRTDFARPTVHARNLCHVTLAMWDAWAAFDPAADQIIHQEKMSPADVQAAREACISHAVYKILTFRFANSPGQPNIQTEFDDLMLSLGYNPAFNNGTLDTPESLGIRIANAVLFWGSIDNSNEADGFANQFYQPINDPLIPSLPGNPTLVFPNRWQPLSLDFIDQGGNPIPFGYPPFLSPEWGQVTAFALKNEDRTIYHRDGFDYWVFHDPGDPPYIGGVGDEYYRWGFELVSIWSSHLDPTDGVMVDISPNAFGNTPLPGVDQWAAYYDLYNGGDWGEGHDTNPATGNPYPPQMVPRGDYARILAEFWADGPHSETPPGHWFTILNYVMDHPLFEKRLRGQGPVLPDLEFDVKAYLSLGGAMHDVAISAWGVKGWYDYLRPISALRYMADQGQRSDPGDVATYDPHGITLHPGFIEVVTASSSMPGQRHEHLAADVGKIAVYAWRGPDYIANPDTDDAGVGWILAENWWPYQRPSFVTPPFAGYVSGHSTYSRAAAELMTLLTGSAFFPGGVGEFYCPQNDFLVFEQGPSVDCTLQWATYRDASDQTSMSRIWGGIHPPCDDLPGRHMGIEIGTDAYWHANRYFNGYISCPTDLDNNNDTTVLDFATFLSHFGDVVDPYTNADFDGDGHVTVLDFADLMENFGACTE